MVSVIFQAILPFVVFFLEINEAAQAPDEDAQTCDSDDDDADP
jgi:hypothetical protein